MLPIIVLIRLLFIVLTYILYLSYRAFKFSGHTARKPYSNGLMFITQ